MRRSIRLLGILALVLVAGCDLTADNPGPIQDDFLDDPGAHDAIVSGIELNLVQGVNMVGFFGSEAAKEYTQGGRIHPIKLPPNPGQLDRDENLPNNAWNAAHQARWVAEDGVRRLRQTRDEFASSPLAARALLYAGYANRLLGENMCEAVIDESNAQNRVVHLERAEGYFSEAREVAMAADEAALATAAQAGRASVRLFMGDLVGAEQDAGEVPRDFQFQLEFGANPESHRNFIQFISNNNPYRAHSVYDTYYEDYYRETGDPRVAWGQDPDVPTAEFEWVPWYFQLKYTDVTSPMNLSSGREMVLIRAEAALEAGSWQEALDLVNSLREGMVSDHDGEPIPLWEADDIEGTWTALKRERGIELWLETRRLGDLWRWVEDGTPGQMEDVSDRIRLCIPIADSELQSNPNLPLDHPDPVNPLFTGS